MKKFLFISFSLVFIACGSQATNEASSEKQEALSGKEVYSIYCVACHGADGKLAFSGATDLSKSELDLETRILQITHGKGVMNAFDKVISKEEIENVASYIEELRN